MTPIEIFAFILILVAAIKIFVVLVKAQAWMKVVRAVYGNPALTAIISLIVGIIILYYLIIVEGLTIVEIFGVMLFVIPLFVLGFCMSNKETIAFAGRALKGNIVKKYWLPLIIWLALIVWVVMELFF